jgi:Protein of unknown function (DUF2752)
MSKRVGRALTLSAAAAAFLYLYFVDPSTSRFAPPCLFTGFVGVHCPGCGSLRALHALAHGDVAAALEFHALLVYVLPLAGALVLCSFLRRSSFSSVLPPLSS